MFVALKVTYYCGRYGPALRERGNYATRFSGLITVGWWILCCVTFKINSIVLS